MPSPNPGTAVSEALHRMISTLCLMQGTWRSIRFALHHGSLPPMNFTAAVISDSTKIWEATRYQVLKNTGIYSSSLKIPSLSSLSHTLRAHKGRTTHITPMTLYVHRDEPLIADGVETASSNHAMFWPSSPPRNASSDLTSCTYCRPSSSGIRCIRS